MFDPLSDSHTELNFKSAWRIPLYNFWSVSMKKNLIKLNKRSDLTILLVGISILRYYESHFNGVHDYHGLITHHCQRTVEVSLIVS